MAKVSYQSPLKKLSALLLLAGLILFQQVSALADDYEMRYIDGALTPGSAESINDSGTVFGYATPPGDAEMQFFIWNENKDIVDVRGDNTYIGINNKGQTVGNYVDPETFHVGVRLRNADGKIIDYAIPEGSAGFAPGSLNDLGQIGCGIEYRNAEGYVDHYELEIMNPDGSIIPIPIGGGLSANVPGINNTGYAIVSTTAVDDYRYYKYSIWDGTDFSELESFEGATDTEAYALNDTGIVVGKSGGHAVRWDFQGHLHDLGIGEAYGVNEKGQIVGKSDNGAVIWNVEGDPLFLPVPEGRYGVARGSNNQGWVVGYLDGGENVSQQAVLWEPLPEPSSFAVVGFCLLPVAGVIRRRLK